MVSEVDSPDVLLIADNFFGYAEDIIDEMSRRGHRVAWWRDRPSLDTPTKLMIRINPSLALPKSRRYYKTLLSALPLNSIRTVIVIKGEGIPLDVLKDMRSRMPEAEFVLYFWDSYLNMPGNATKLVDHFDRALSFDPKDVSSDRRLTYRPLFFTEQFDVQPSGTEIYDLSFVGTAHTDRLYYLDRIASLLPPGTSHRWIAYYPSPALFAVKMVASRPFFAGKTVEMVFKPLSRQQVISVISQSHVVVDIHRRVQSGYTMRTIEMLGAGKKLLTTNRAVAEADFFRPENIAVIDRDTKYIPLDFIKTPYSRVPPEIRDRYSLRAWVDDVLGRG